MKTMNGFYEALLYGRDDVSSDEIKAYYNKIMAKPLFANAVIAKLDAYIETLTSVKSKAEFTKIWKPGRVSVWYKYNRRINELYALRPYIIQVVVGATPMDKDTLIALITTVLGDKAHDDIIELDNVRLRLILRVWLSTNQTLERRTK